METSKKVIEQTGIVNRNIEISVSEDGKIILNQNSKFDYDTIVIKKEQATEVAKAIDPEYQNTVDRNIALTKRIEELEQKAIKYDSLKQHCDIISSELDWEREVVVKDLEQKNESLQSQLNEAVELLAEADTQIEYLHQKFKPTGTGNSVLSRIKNFLTKLNQK